MRHRTTKCFWSLEAREPRLNTLNPKTLDPKPYTLVLGPGKLFYESHAKMLQRLKTNDFVNNLHHVSYSLKSLQGIIYTRSIWGLGLRGGYIGSMIGVTKGDTRGLGYSSCPSNGAPLQSCWRGLPTLMNPCRVSFSCVVGSTAFLRQIGELQTTNIFLFVCKTLDCHRPPKEAHGRHARPSNPMLQGVKGRGPRRVGKHVMRDTP